MHSQIAIHIPTDWLTGVPEEELTLKQIFRLGLQQYKVARALQLYRDGVGSLGYIAEQLGLDKQTLIQEARLQHIDPEFSEETIQEELT